ncbi:MAG: xanthine dehydrogenase family protein molybdopterin-binding subunit, partial [Gammaproteobacteria bacterium]|nr:xanthine dehydrogenase family protein molybdopterin-binding subunit [Gammaproteobacteria bacterium]
MTGKATYGIDIKIPGMVYAAVARCPFFEGSIGSVDAAKALEIKGVESVQVIDNWVAVVADNTWSAIKGRDALQIVWEGT